MAELPVPPPFAPLLSSRLCIRPWTAEDDATGTISNWVRQESYSRYIKDTSHEMVADTREKAAKLLDVCASPVGELYALTLRHDSADGGHSAGTVVGNAGIFLAEGFDSRSIGYGLDPAHWGHGYAQEAVLALLTHLFDSSPAPVIAEDEKAKVPDGKQAGTWHQWDGKVRIVFADTHRENKAAQRVMERCGMRTLREGEAEMDEYKLSRFVRAITRDEWEKRRSAATQEA